MEEEEEELSPEEAMLKRHRAQTKQLQAKIQQLKKSVSNDKKRKKVVQEEIAALQKDLQDRHTAELAELKSSSNEPEVCAKEIESLSINNHNAQKSTIENNEVDEDDNCSKGKKVSRAEKRRQKKSAATKEREAIIKEAESNNRFSARNVEAQKIKTILKTKSLKMHDISPDGNCLYAAVAHQLGPDASVASLRSKAADFIRSHVDDFLPFITDSDTGDLLSPEQFQEYCRLLENTPAWGGQPELRALSQTLKRKIEVLQAEGSPIVFGEEFPAEETLYLAYYRHYYGLGEHYNSVVPSRKEAEADEA